MIQDILLLKIKAPVFGYVNSLVNKCYKITYVNHASIIKMHIDAKDVWMAFMSIWRQANVNSACQMDIVNIATNYPYPLFIDQIITSTHMMELPQPMDHIAILALLEIQAKGHF